MIFIRPNRLAVYLRFFRRICSSLPISWWPSRKENVVAYSYVYYIHFTYTLIFLKIIQMNALPPLLFKIRITKRNKAKISCEALKVAWQPSIFHFYLWNIFLHHYLWWTRLNCMWFICCYCYSKITWLSRHRLACFHTVNFENSTPVGLYTNTKNIYNTWLLSKAFPLVVKFYKTFPS